MAVNQTGKRIQSFCTSGCTCVLLLTEKPHTLDEALLMDSDHPTMQKRSLAVLVAHQTTTPNMVEKRHTSSFTHQLIRVLNWIGACFSHPETRFAKMEKKKFVSMIMVTNSLGMLRGFPVFPAILGTTLMKNLGN